MSEKDKDDVKEQQSSNKRVSFGKAHVRLVLDYYSDDNSADNMSLTENERKREKERKETGGKDRKRNKRDETTGEEQFDNQRKKRYITRMCQNNVDSTLT